MEVIIIKLIDLMNILKHRTEIYQTASLNNNILRQKYYINLNHLPKIIPLGGLNLNTASAVTLMSGFFNPRLLCDSRINTNLSKDLNNIANDLMLRHNLHSNANLNLFLNMRFGTLANQVTTVNNDKNKIDQKPCTEKLSSPLFNLPFSSVSLLQQSISSPMQFGNNLIKSFLPFMSSIHSNFTWPNFLTKNGTNTDLVSLQQQENFDSIPFSKQHLELSNAHNVNYITGAGTQKQKSNEGFDKEINKNNEIEVQTYENRQFSANRKRRHGGIFVNQRHFGIENTSCPQKSLSFSQEEEREKPLIKNVIEDSIHFTNMQTSQSASIKRCKLDLKDASDKETTNDSLNVNNKNDSPQQFLKPHIQQGLWRPFTL
ncbi:hypothetical protein Mgra_00003939 [Meloidogyne graminicola]|uniref:Uncharacterized protein n=1 Tax=Meloidogyne graminicola TaxID=189291 RepID=A0A8S9ZU83_9BILA|nr:hypothetical protein Mgra_00003939 [Meloidogyne graminicola]